MHLEDKPEKDRFDFSLTFFLESFIFVTPTPVTPPSLQTSGSFCCLFLKLHCIFPARPALEIHLIPVPVCIQKKKCPMHEIASSPGH